MKRLDEFVGSYTDNKVKELNAKAFRAEASRVASMANKRIQRLEKAGLESSPAYRKWIDEGGQKFGVKGKTYNEVQSELARMRRFIDAKTSTIRGVNDQLKEMAINTGMDYKNLAELRSKSEAFFELSSKVEQYLRTVDDIASAIGYQKIWEAVNQYVKVSEADLSSTNIDIDQMAHNISQALADIDSGEIVHKSYSGDNFWFKVK